MGQLIDRVPLGGMAALSVDKLVTFRGRVTMAKQKRFPHGRYVYFALSDTAGDFQFFLGKKVSPALYAGFNNFGQETGVSLRLPT